VRISWLIVARPQQLDPIHERHQPVADDDVCPVGLEQPPRFEAILGHQARMAVVAGTAHLARRCGQVGVRRLQRLHDGQFIRGHRLTGVQHEAVTPCDGYLQHFAFIAVTHLSGHGHPLLNPLLAC
jgi:hypothetical protein